MRRKAAATTENRVPVLPAVPPAKPRNQDLQERLRKMAAARAEQKAAAEVTECHRKARRKPTSLPGLITFRTMRMQIPCTIADMSGTGAQLRVTHATATAYGNLEDIPDRLNLVLRADRMQVDCEVKWRHKTSLGVRFLGPPKPLPKG